MKGIIAGVCAGIAGAVLWAVIAAVTGFEIGWLAWGIGAGVGAAVAWGSDCTPATGVLAVVISLLAIVAGKYIAVEIVMHKELGGTNQEIANLMEDEEYLISWLADGIVYNLEEAGQTVTWPAGVDPDDAMAKADYPPAVWAQAEQAWSAMTPDEKTEFKEQVRQQVDASMGEVVAGAKKEGFMASFGLFDALFFFLAIGTAYKIGSNAD